VDFKHSTFVKILMSFEERSLRREIPKDQLINTGYQGFLTAFEMTNGWVESESIY